MWRRKRMLDELEEDIREHIERETQDNIERGMAPEEARYAARRKFGNVTSVKEQVREVWIRVWLDQLLQDLRYAFRTLRKAPGFAATAVLTLALGIGANAVIYSIVSAVLLRPLPFEEPDRLVAVWESNPRWSRVWVSYLNFRDWQRSAHSFEQMAALREQGFDLTSPGVSEHLKGQQISSGFFRTLGTGLTLGREFLPEEDRPGGAPVAIISNRLWRSRFGASAETLGRSLTLDGLDRAIVGVAPQGFGLAGDADVYTPLGQGDPLILSDRGSHDGFFSIARLEPSRTISIAQAEMSTIQNGLDQLYPDANRDLGIYVEPLKQVIVGDIGGRLALLAGAVGLVLVIACANVANLLLVRSAARGREFAVRLAVGANRARLVRQLLTESVLLSLAGAGVGLLIAVWGVKALLPLVSDTLPRSETIGVNAPVLLFTLGVAIAVGILFGLAPALKSGDADLQTRLKEGARGSTGTHHRAQSGLVIVQMALTLVLLIGAGLLVQTIRQLSEVNPGFQSQQLITFKVGVSHALTKTAASTRTAYQQLIERIRQIPGVQAADFTDVVPLNGEGGTMPFWIGSQKPESLQAAPRLTGFLTGPDYLRTMGIPLLRGRFFTPADTTKSPCVMVIDSVFASMYFPNSDPLSQTITAGFAPVGPCRIVGVVGHVKLWELGGSEGVQNEMYFPLYQDPDPWVARNYGDLTVVVRTPLDATILTPAIKAAVDEAGADQPVFHIRTMQEIVSESMSLQRFPMMLLGVFAASALLLASVGIYGVISYSVTQRVQEIGIRITLGAERQTIFRQVVGQGLRLAVVGLVIGAAAALVLTRVVSSFSRLLYGVGASDPATFAGVAAVLTGVAMLACYVPARRAMRVDPMVALRYE